MPLFDANGARLFRLPEEITPLPGFIDGNGRRLHDRDVADVRWQAAGPPLGSAPALIPTLTALVGLYGAYQQIAHARAPAPPPPAPLPPPTFPITRIPTRGAVGQLVLRGGIIAAAWVVRIFRRYGIVIAQAVWDAYQEARIRGETDATAKARAKAMHGVSDRGGRRMNPANVRALRRAIRRVRSFQRITRKVERVLPRAHRHARPWARSRGRRGDVGPFYAEDQADVYDEAEDFGYDPAGFDID